MPLQRQKRNKMFAMMNETYAAVCELLKETFAESEADSPLCRRGCDWHAVYTEMQCHSVATLCFRWLRAHPLPDAALQKTWMNDCVRQQGRWLRAMAGQARLVDLLEKNGVPCVVIKGAAAAAAYPHPSLRMMGDVDVLVKREDFERAAALMESSGYSLLPGAEMSTHHNEYEKDGVVYELHKRLAIVRETDEELMALFEGGIDHRVWQSIEGIAFPTLPTDLNGLVLLFHINQHLRSGIGLRPVLDWMMFLRANDDLDAILPVFRKTGLEKLALSVTALCQRYLGMPEIVKDSPEYPCDELMAYIMAKGDFGKKKGKEGSAEWAFLMMDSPAHFMRRLRNGGLSRWKAAQKYPALRPFAWLYQIGSIIRELIEHKVTPAKIMEMRKKGLRQRELIKRLGLDTRRII